MANLPPACQESKPQKKLHAAGLHIPAPPFILSSMNLWLLTSIRLEPATALRASSIQNLQTAMALAEQGHRVLLWVAHRDPQCGALIEQRLGRPLPAGVRLLAYTPHGPAGEKKTPFFSRLDRLFNIARARWAAPPPDAIITRSPRAIGQLRHSRLAPPGARLVLEYQYPEWAQLWREWRRRHKTAPTLGEATRRLREWRRQEDAWLGLADGILYAARGHETLLAHAGYDGPAGWLPSGCLAPAGAPAGTAVDYELGYVGALAPENGLEGLLEALARMPGARLLLIGGGRPAYVKGLQELAGRVGVAGRVEFSGAVDFCQVRPLLRRCRVGLVPLSRRQGPEKRQFASPLKLVEWMAAGVPVAATAVPSVCQFAVHERNCLLVAPEAPAALAAAAAQLLADPALATTLAQAGLADAARVAWPARARQIAGFIQALPGGKQRSAPARGGV